VHPARFEADPRRELRADREFRFEQDAAAERDLVRVEELAGRAVVDGDAEARAT